MVVNKAKMFVDYGEYPKEEYVNRLPVIPVTMDGPKMGKKRCVFKVYNKASYGLCCSLGKGYYRILPSSS